MLSSLYQKVHAKACPLVPRSPLVLDVADLVLAASDRAPLVLALVAPVLAAFHRSPLLFAVADLVLAVFDLVFCQVDPISAFYAAI